VGLNQNWTYEFGLPVADYRTEPAAISYGMNTDLVGVDGRFVGVLKRAPGFDRCSRLALTTTGESSGFQLSAFSTGFRRSRALDFFRYAEVYKGTTGVILRGFVVRTGHTLAFHYYDPQEAQWLSHTISEESAGPIDITYGPRAIYYTSSRRRGRTVFWHEGEFVNLPFGPAHPSGAMMLVPSGPMSTNKATGALSTPVNQDGRYQVGVRLSDSRRGAATPLSWYMLEDPLAPSWVRETPAVPPSSSLYYLAMGITISPEDARSYDTIEVYRSIREGSYLYRALTWHAPSEVAGAQTLADLTGVRPTLSGGVTNNPPSPLGEQGGVVIIQLGNKNLNGNLVTLREGVRCLTSGVDDTLLSYLSSFDFQEDTAAGPIRASTLLYSGGALFAAGDDLNTTRDGGDIRFSVLTQQMPEIFPGLNVHGLARSSDRILRFLKSGSLVCGISRDKVYRLTRVGNLVASEQMDTGWGAVGAEAATNLGPDLVFLSSSALLSIQASSGTLSTISIVDRILNHLSEWGESRASVFLAYDAAMAVLYLINPVKEEALLVWGTSNTVTRRKDMNFVAATSGVHPVYGGGDRVFLVTATGLVVSSPMSTEPTTQLGIEGTINGVVRASSSGSELHDPTAQFAADLVDCYLYVLTGENAGEKRRITSNTVHRLALDSPLSVEKGDRYTISPVPFEVVGWPLGSSEDPNLPRDYFVRRRTRALGAYLRLPGGKYGTPTDDHAPYPLVTVGVYDDMSEPPVHSDSFVVQQETHDNFGRVVAGRGTLLPFVQCLVSGLPLEMISMVVSGEVDDTMEM